MRRLVLGELAVLAAVVNEFFYEAAICANRVQGWLLRRRDLVPRHISPSER